MSLDHATRSPACRRAVSIGRIVNDLGDALRAWQTRARQRRETAALSDHDLQDIGLTRAQLGHEMAKPFWRR